MMVTIFLFELIKVLLFSLNVKKPPETPFKFNPCGRARATIWVNEGLLSVKQTNRIPFHLGNSGFLHLQYIGKQLDEYWFLGLNIA